MMLALMLLILPVMAQDEVVTIYDLPYFDNAHELQTLDIFLPEDAGDSTYPVLFLVHGGGFIIGDKSEVHPAAMRYAEQGYAVITPNYRLAPDVHFPDAHSDVFCAMAWTLAHAEDYNLDLSRIVLMGESAGANIVAYLATVDDATDFTRDCEFDYPENPDYDAAITFYLPVDLLSCECQFARSMASQYLNVNITNWNDADVIADFVEDSVLSWLDSDDPPFYMIHGENDFVVPLSESEFFVDAYQSAGGYTELVVIEGANHGFLTSGIESTYLAQSYELIDEWLNTLFTGDDIDDR